MNKAPLIPNRIAIHENVKSQTQIIEPNVIPMYESISDFVYLSP